MLKNKKRRLKNFCLIFYNSDKFCLLFLFNMKQIYFKVQTSYYVVKNFEFPHFA